jgi:dCMP deaminase
LTEKRTCPKCGSTKVSGGWMHHQLECEDCGWIGNIEEKKQEVTMRPTFDEVFMDIAHLMASRSTCVRRKVGAVIVKNKHVLSTGYNGPPKGVEHCTKETCIRTVRNIPSGERHELCRGLHAEQNAIIQAAIFGTPIAGSTIYITFTPCIVCAKMLINAEIKKIIYEGNYPDKLALDMLKEADIEMIQYDKKQKERH